MGRAVVSVNNLRRQSRFDNDETSTNSATRTHSRISTFASRSPVSAIPEYPDKPPQSQLTISGDRPPTPMGPKKYCCSDSPQSESKIWAIFDIVCACLILIVLIYFLITLKSDREFLEALVEQNKNNERDLKRFLEYSSLKQDLVMTVVIVREFVSILLGALLYASAKTRTHYQLRIWLGSTFVAIVVDLFLFIPKMTFTQNKFVYVSTMIGYFLYKWYEVWIVTLLFREIRQEEADHLVGEMNPSFETEERENHDKPPAYPSGMSDNFILSQPPKKNRFRTTPNTDITIVQTKSPVQIEQLNTVRY